MLCPRFFLIAALLTALSVGASHAQPVLVGSEEALAWSRYLVPLPRSFAIDAKIVLNPATVAVLPQSHSDIVINQALQELRVSLGRSKNASNPYNPLFTLTLQLGGVDAAPLNGLKNRDQAYLIVPQPGNTGLRVIALAPRGLYYGAKTLQQLIAPRRTAGSAEMPILTVTDWPELMDRGLWGGDSASYLRWMADRKMNYIEQIGRQSCYGSSPWYAQIHSEGPYYGMQPVHCVFHLEQQDTIWSHILYCYPQLAAVGSAGPGAWCYSRPEAVTVLARWIADLNGLAYQENVDVWMSENLKGLGGCKCSQCAPMNRGVMEARAIVGGWKKAMQTSGPMGLMILTTETTRHDNDDVVEDLWNEPTIKFWHYDGLVTYFVREESIVDDALAQWAAAGRYSGEVPLLCPTTKCFQPWTCPQFVHYRMQEMKRKNISGLMGFTKPAIALYKFNTEAAAEWSWNPDGRSPREFAVSWAVREGLANPELFADWLDALGPVSWDIYGSEYPRGELRKNQNCGPIATALRNGTLQELGQVKLTIYPAPWADIRNLDQLNADVAGACRALTLVGQVGLDECYYETLVIHGYITALRALYELKSLVVRGQVAPENRQLASTYFSAYVTGLKQANDALPRWEESLGGSGTTVGETVSLLNDDISQMTSLASSLGCPISSPSAVVPVTSIPEAKTATDGTYVMLAAEVVTSAANGSYIQDVDGPPMGIRVQSTLPLTVGEPVIVMGNMGTSMGERFVKVTTVFPSGTLNPARPLAMKTADIGGSSLGRQPAPAEYRCCFQNGEWIRKLQPAVGVHNLGVLVRIAGRVSAVGGDHFYVDDGSKWDDGSGNSGIRVICGSISKPAVGDVVVVTGVSSMYFERSKIWKALVLPDAGSLEIL